MGFLKRLFSGQDEKENAQPTQKESNIVNPVQQSGKSPALIVNRLNEISWNDWNNPPPNVLIKENVKIAGVTHNNPDGVSRQEILARMMRWEVVDLVREPGNPHDPNAVAIFGGMGQIGYVPMVAIPGLHKILDAGIKTQCKLTNLYGGKEGKSWGGTIDIHIVAPLGATTEARVVGITGKNEEGVSRADIADWLEVGNVVALEVEEDDEGESIIKVLHENEEFGRLGKKDAGRVLQFVAEGKMFGATISAVDGEDGNKKITIAIVQC